MWLVATIQDGAVQECPEISYASRKERGHVQWEKANEEEPWELQGFSELGAWMLAASDLRQIWPFFVGEGLACFSKN